MEKENIIAEAKDKIKPIKEFTLKKGEGIMETIKLRGELELVLRDKDGKLKERRLIKNTITATGKAEVIGLIVDDVGGTAFDYIAIGEGTPTSTALGDEITTSGGQRRGGTDVTGTRETTSTTGDTAKFTTTFTFSGSFAITEEGIFNNSSGGTMLACQSFDAVNVVANDTLTVIHKIIASSS